MKCKHCNKELEREGRIYCNDKCMNAMYYKKNKETIKENTRKWEKANPEQTKINKKKALDKFRKNKPERFNELMMNGYRRHKDKWHSRNYTKSVINAKKKKTSIKRQCNCGSKTKLSLKFLVYPLTAKDIRKAIDKKKIFYICRECRYG